MREVNRRIAKLRAKRGFTQEKLAERMNDEIKKILSGLMRKRLLDLADRLEQYCQDGQKTPKVKFSIRSTVMFGK